MILTDVKSLLGDFDSKYKGAQPTMLRLPLFYSEVESKEYFKRVTNIFDFFISNGKANASDKPDFINHFCDFTEIEEFCEKNPNLEFDDILINSRKEFGTGETLGTSWINHEFLGNQIGNLINGIILGINSFHMIYEGYFGDSICVNVDKNKTTQVCDYTFVYIDDKYINMNLSLHNPDVEDIIFQHTLRHLLAKFIQSSPKMRNLQIGHINIFINNLDTNTPYNPLSMERIELFVPYNIDYPGEYYFGEKVNLSECLK